MREREKQTKRETDGRESKRRRVLREKNDILRERNEGYEEERGRIRKTGKRKEENKTHRDGREGEKDEKGLKRQRDWERKRMFIKTEKGRGWK